MAGCRDIIKIMERFAPPNRAEQWDNVGLLLGDKQAKVHAVLVTLDVDLQVVNEAVEQGADMIVAHHPFLFQPVKKIDFETANGELIKQLIKNDISVYAAHTNLDSADAGVNFYLAEKLGLKDAEILAPSGSQQLYKLVVFVPTQHLEIVRMALGDAGAGWIGSYSHCTYQSAGQGTFKPLEGTNPFIGQVGTIEQVDEYRLETIVSKDRLKPVMDAMFNSHPYEEVAYDIYPLVNEGSRYGLGRVGRLEQEETLKSFAEKVKTALGAVQIRLAGPLDCPISTAAVCGGAGASLIGTALAKGADVLVTGDVKYHEAQDALAAGMAVIDAGHYATEQLIVPALTRHLQEELKKAHTQVEVFASKINTNPWYYL